MTFTCAHFWFVYLYSAATCISAIRIVDERNVKCNDVPEGALTEILGPAFNSRYMSIDRPPEEDAGGDRNGKRTAGLVPSFYVDDDYVREIGKESPAWTLVNHVAVRIDQDGEGAVRKRRRANGMQWECESEIVWHDLGRDYFPRYLRSVECLLQSCWFGHFHCKPRSFAVKLLRRKKGRCSTEKNFGNAGLPLELRQLWVWEERAVNFCCDCSL